MIQLLTPFWLIALSGVLIPILIHLWNRKPGKTIKVGTIRWLEAAASKRLRSLRLHDWLLLLLRLFIVTLLALVLTQPQWIHTVLPSAQKQVLISKSVLASRNLLSLKPTIDSLRKQGYELRLFSSGFPAISGQEWSRSTQSLSDTLPSEADYWTLLRALDQQIPSLSSAWLVTDGQFRHFQGERPGVSFPVTWVSLPLDEAHEWLQEAFLTSTDSLRIVMGRSDAKGTTFRRMNFNLPTRSTVLSTPNLPASTSSPIKFIKDQDSSLVEWKGQRIPVQAVAKRITLFADESRMAEARYLEAALQAWMDVTQQRFELTTTRQLSDSIQSDWLFWLSDRKIPPPVKQRLSQGLQVVKEAADGNARKASTQLFIPGISSSFALYRLTDEPPLKETTLWEDNLGNPVLTFQAIGKGGLYTFRSRFDPQWNALTESGHFPQVVGQLLHPPLPMVSNHDWREIDEQQLMPVRISTGLPKKTSPFSSDLRLALGGLALVLLALERVLVYVKAKAVNYSRKAKELV